MTLMFSNLFPQKYSQNSMRLKYKAILGIGGNVGNTVLIFKKLLLYLKNSPNIKLLQTSPILINPAFGYIKQKDFHNAVLLIDTSLKPRQLLSLCLRLEQRLGRKRSFKNAPRTIDIDIIDFANHKVKQKDLYIPHLDYQNRNSVIIPMSFLK